jgi:hypothetical protein
MHGAADIVEQDIAGDREHYLVHTRTRTRTLEQLLVFTVIRFSDRERGGGERTDGEGERKKRERDEKKLSERNRQNSRVIEGSRG